MRTHILVVLTGIALLPGCGNKAGAGTGTAGDRPHVDGTLHTDQVLDAWKSAGLTPEAFTSIDPAAYRAGYCAQGRVGGVDAIVCEYRDDDSLDSAKKLIQDGWSREGVQTAVAMRTKRTLLSVADRARVDPNGKTISKLVETFKKL